MRTNQLEYDMELTPFEKAELGRKNTIFLQAALGTTREMLTIIDESSIHIDFIKDLFLDGIKLTETERAVTAEAMRDSKLATQTLCTVATLLEEKLGISA